MISKVEQKKGGDHFITGGGFPYDRPERSGPGQTPAERGRPVAIDLSKLNQPGKAPINFSRTAGQRLASFSERDRDEELDIE